MVRLWIGALPTQLPAVAVADPSHLTPPHLHSQQRPAPAYMGHAQAPRRPLPPLHSPGTSTRHPPIHLPRQTHRRKPTSVVSTWKILLCSILGPLRHTHPLHELRRPAAYLFRRPCRPRARHAKGRAAQLSDRTMAHHPPRAMVLEHRVRAALYSGEYEAVARCCRGDGREDRQSLGGSVSGPL